MFSLPASFAFIIVTPEYNYGNPAPLKSLIDSVGPEWHAKPAAFVSYADLARAPSPRYVDPADSPALVGRRVAYRAPHRSVCQSRMRFS